MPQSSSGRKSAKILAWLLIASLFAGIVLEALFGPRLLWQSLTSNPTTHIDLYQSGIGVLADGRVVEIAPKKKVSYLPYSRVLAQDSDDTYVVLNAQDSSLPNTDAWAAWLKEKTYPGQDTEFADLGLNALLDLKALTVASGPVLAAPSARWRYIWPRDGAFAISAYAASGFLTEAHDSLTFFQKVQPKHGKFQARYLPDGSGTPDNRGTQLDGTGWLLWALGNYLDAVPASEYSQRAAEFAKLQDTSTEAIISWLNEDTGLPPVSSDYWEVKETKLTLGTAAPLLSGLQTSARIYEKLGQETQAQETRKAAGRLAKGIEKEFKSDGYPRHLGENNVDAAVMFLLPPFTQTPLLGSKAAWEQSWDKMARPAGGIAPGSSWKQDGISWTPQTSLYALAAAYNGDEEKAREILRWLQDHRTVNGSLPEKVLSNGAPAAVAPLSWTGSVVLLTLAKLTSAE